MLTQDVPLPELFRQAQDLAEQAATISAQQADTRARQAEAIRALARCDQLVDSLAFFSRRALCEHRHQLITSGLPASYCYSPGAAAAVAG